MEIWILLAIFSSSCYCAALNSTTDKAFYAALDRSKTFTSETTTAFTLKRTKFTCSITLTHSYTVVDIKNSKLQCEPSKPSRLKQKNIRFTVKAFSFLMDISVNPTKILKAVITNGPPEPTKATTTTTKTNKASSFSTTLKTTESYLEPTTTSPPLDDKLNKHFGKPSIQNKLELYKKDRNKTTIAMFLAQSSFLRELVTEDQKQNYLTVSIKNGLRMAKQCPMADLIGCNNDFRTTVCIKKGPENYVECQVKHCANCACALGSLLGYDCDSGSMVRMIRNSSLTMSEYGNVLSSPYEFSKGAKFKEHLYTNYFGGLSNESTTDKLKKSLSEHEVYWTSGLVISDNTPTADNTSTAETIIEVGTSLAKTIQDTALKSAEEIDDQIQTLKKDADKLTNKAREEIAEVQAELFIMETYVTETRNKLEALAQETIERVDSMLYYLKLVQDDWEQAKIAKFLKFEGKKMAELVDRSLNLLKDVDMNYKNISLNLDSINGKLGKLETEITNLLKSGSPEHDARVAAIRQEVYIPCCILSLGLACPICVGVLETKINEWEDEIKAVNERLKNQVNAILAVTKSITKYEDELENEMKLILRWQGQLIKVSEIDWTFPETEIFEFSDIRTDVAKTLNGLKTAAKNYLER